MIAFVVFLLVAGALCVFYLMPHRIERDLPVVDARLVTYAKWGHITKEEIVDIQGSILQVREFRSWFVPLYRFRDSGRLTAEKTYYFENPSKPHWSECVTYIDNQTMVVQKDPDQDGIVDDCECKPAEWGM
jgi:hypothetical protein